jgi:hypothetical protein
MLVLSWDVCLFTIRFPSKYSLAALATFIHLINMGQDAWGNYAPVRDFSLPSNWILLIIEIGAVVLLLGMNYLVLSDKKRSVRTKIFVTVAVSGAFLTLFFDVIYRYVYSAPPIIGWLNMFLCNLTSELVVPFL